MQILHPASFATSLRRSLEHPFSSFLRLYGLPKSSFGDSFPIIQDVQVAESFDNHAVSVSRLYTPVLAIMSTVPPAGDLSKIPLLPNPNPAIPSNFVNPPTLAPAIEGVGITLAIVATILVAVRLHSNARAVRKLGWDDCFCVLGLVFTLAFTALGISIDHTARHAWDVPLSFIDASYSKRVVSHGMVYPPGVYFTKAAILVLYLRIFSVKRVMRGLIYVGLIVLFLVYATFIPLTVVFCTPRNGGAWDLVLLQKCQQTTGIAAVVQAVFGLLSDIYILILPLPITWNLNLKLKKKIGLAVVFMSAGLIIIATALGLYYKVQNFQAADPTWDAALAYIWQMVENYVTVIVSCAPAVASFWRNVIAKSGAFLKLQSYLRRGRGSASSDKRSTELKIYSSPKQPDSESQSNLHAVDCNRNHGDKSITKSVTIQQTWSP